MYRQGFQIVALLCWALSASRAAARLVLSADRLTVYDSANGVTWLADANLAASNPLGIPVCNGSNAGAPTCFNASASMFYQAVAAWIAAMNPANYRGHTNWQLPTTPAVDNNCRKTGPSGGGFGFGCTAGELDILGSMAPNTAGFGQTLVPVVSGSESQSGTRSPLPAVSIGGIPASVSYAAFISLGLFQFNVVVPIKLTDGDQLVTATYNGLSTQAGTLITVHQ